MAFHAEEGERVTVLVDPESILVARGKFPSSARNVFRGTVEDLRRSADPIELTVVIRAGSALFRVTVTEESVRQLRLVRGAPVWLYVKATALRRVGRAPAGTSRAPQLRT